MGRPGPIIFLRVRVKSLCLAIFDLQIAGATSYECSLLCAAKFVQLLFVRGFFAMVAWVVTPLRCVVRYFTETTVKETL